MITKLGFLLFIIGAAGMDSPNRTAPVIMVLSGLAIIAVSAFLERRKHHGIYVVRRNGIDK